MEAKRNDRASADVKPVTVKTANKSIRVMRQEANLKREQRKNPNAVAPIQDDDSDALALDDMLTDIIGRVISLKLNKSDPEFKIFREHHERGVEYFHERFNYLPDEIVVDIFIKIQDHTPEVVQLI